MKTLERDSQADLTSTWYFFAWAEQAPSPACISPGRCEAVVRTAERAHDPIQDLHLVQMKDVPAPNPMAGRVPQEMRACR